MIQKEPTNMSKEDSDYAVARIAIDGLKALVLSRIKKARQRMSWSEKNDEYFAEEIARDIYNEWKDKKLTHNL